MKYSVVSLILNNTHLLLFWIVFTIDLDIMAQKRKMWSTESMEAAVESVKDGKGLWEASRLYN